MKQCECKYEKPSILFVATKPSPSALDVKTFGIMLICPKCEGGFFLTYERDYSTSGIDVDNLLEKSS